MRISYYKKNRLSVSSGTNHERRGLSTSFFTTAAAARREGAPFRLRPSTQIPCTLIMNVVYKAEVCFNMQIMLQAHLMEPDISVLESLH